MRTMLLAACGAIGFLFVPGCVSGIGMLGEDAYVVTSASPDAITLRFREGDLNKATARAQAHCQTTQRKAEMVNVMPSDGYSLGSFRCT